MDGQCKNTIHSHPHKTHTHTNTYACIAIINSGAMPVYFFRWQNSTFNIEGPVVQSIITLTGSLVVKMQMSSKHNIWVAFFFSKNISIYAIFNDQSFNDSLTNGIVCFEQLGPDQCWSRQSLKIFRLFLFSKIYFKESQGSFCALFGILESFSVRMSLNLLNLSKMNFSFGFAAIFSPDDTCQKAVCHQKSDWLLRTCVQIRAR